MLGSTVVQNATFFWIFSSKSVSGGFYWLILALVFSCAGVPLLYSLIFKVIIYEFSVRPRHVLRETCLISLRRISVVWIKSAAYKYWDSSGLKICARILFTTFSECFVSRDTSHIPVFLFLVPLIISFPLFWIEIYCLYNVMVHPSSHKTPNDINGTFYIFW